MGHGDSELRPAERFAESGGSRFLRFGDELIAEYYQGGLVSRFVPGAALDETAARLNGSGVRSWYYPDERGSTIAVAGDAGTASQIVAYDEYGRPGTASPPRIGYTGQPLLSFGLLYDYRNRLYHAGLGRFLQPDPIGYEAGLNLYAYVGGDPVNFTDPLGLIEGNEDIVVTAWRLFGGAGGGGGGGGRIPATLLPLDAPIPGNPAGCGDPECNVPVITGRRPPTGAAPFFFNGRRWVRDPKYRDPWYAPYVEYGFVFGPPVLGLAGALIPEALLGTEISIGVRARLAPFGNRAGNKYGRWPHYHRQRLTPKGKVARDQGIKRHRPWEPRTSDSSWLDRF